MEAVPVHSIPIEPYEIRFNGAISVLEKYTVFYRPLVVKTQTLTRSLTRDAMCLTSFCKLAVIYLIILSLFKTKQSCAYNIHPTRPF